MKNLATFPDSVSVNFPGKRCASDQTIAIPSKYTKNYKRENIPGFTASGFRGAKILSDYALALYSAAGSDPTNKAALDALAKQTAKDYYQWKTESFDRVYNGVLNTKNSSLYEEIILDYSIDGCSTRLLTGDLNDDPEQLMHFDPANASCTATRTPLIDAFGPKSSLSGGSTSFNHITFGLVDGRLSQSYIGQSTAACTGCCTTVFNRTVRDCGINISGVVVDLKIGGVIVATGTTNGSGFVSISYTGTGSPATLVYTPPAGPYYLPLTESVTLDCGTHTSVVALPLAEGYSCTPDSCCLAADQPGPPYAVPVNYPDTTYLTDPVGTITMSRVTGHGRVTYVGSATRSAFRYGAYDSDFAACRVLEGPMDVGLLYVVSCFAGGGWVLAVFSDLCYDPNSDICGAVFGSIAPPCNNPLMYPAIGCAATIANVNFPAGINTNDSASIDSFPHCPPVLAGSFTIFLRTPIFGGGFCPMAMAVCPWIYGDATYSVPSVTFAWSE